jgi:hypothetical protein
MADYLENNPGVIDQIKPIFTKWKIKQITTYI